MSQYNEIQQVRRFRANPIEVVFLTLISLIFMNSLYSLIYTQHGIQTAALTPMSSHPTYEGRSIASVPSSLLNLNFDCDKTLPETTTASRVRVSGLICGYNPSTVGENNKTPVIDIRNKTNRNAATVFSDSVSGKFSTDYLTLDSGQNIIQIEIRLGTGKTISREVLINKS